MNEIFHHFPTTTEAVIEQVNLLLNTRLPQTSPLLPVIEPIHSQQISPETLSQFLDLFLPTFASTRLPEYDLEEAAIETLMLEKTGQLLGKFHNSSWWSGIA